MSERAKLSIEVVARAEAGEKATWIYDTEIPGFCLSVSPKGRKVYYQLGKINRQTVRVKLGRHPTMTAQEARKKARQVAGQLAEGKVPDQVAARKSKTLKELFDAYFQGHAVVKKKTADRDRKNFDKYFADWKSHRIQSITKGQVTEKLDRLQEISIGAAHDARSLLSVMFSFAIEREWVDKNPVLKTPRPKYEPRERFLKPTEVGAFFAALNEHPRELTRDYIFLLIWTGQRRRNVASICKSEIDREAKVWEIPKEKFKGKRRHLVPLIPQAMEIIDRRWETAPGDYLFPGQGRVPFISAPYNAMLSIIKRAGEIMKAPMPHITIHDLRRTLGAWQSAANVTLRTIQKTLGHASIATTAASYTPTELDAVRKSIEVFAAKIEEAVSRRPDPSDIASASLPPSPPDPK
jgi:integrase